MKNFNFNKLIYKCHLFSLELQLVNNEPHGVEAPNSRLRLEFRLYKLIPGCGS